MKRLLFSSGTTGFPTATEVDQGNIIKSAAEFVDIYGGKQGVIYNLFLAGPNIGFWIVEEYARQTNSLIIDVGTINPQQVARLFLTHPPVYIAGIGNNIINVLKESTKANYKTLKFVIAAKGVEHCREELEKLLPRNCQLYATYGLTEAERAWTTCSDLDCGYHVLDWGLTKSKDGELLYRGIPTGDLADVDESQCTNCGRNCQRISLRVSRMNGLDVNRNKCGI